MMSKISTIPHLGSARRWRARFGCQPKQRSCSGGCVSRNQFRGAVSRRGDLATPRAFASRELLNFACVNALASTSHAASAVLTSYFLLRSLQLDAHRGYTDLGRQETRVGIVDRHALPAFF